VPCRSLAATSLRLLPALLVLASAASADPGLPGGTVQGVPPTVAGGVPEDPVADAAAAGATAAPKGLTITIHVANDPAQPQPQARHTVSDSTLECLDFLAPLDLDGAPSYPIGAWEAGTWRYQVRCTLAGEQRLERHTLDQTGPRSWDIVAWYRTYHALCKDPTASARASLPISSIEVTSACGEGVAAHCSSSPLPFGDGEAAALANLARACRHEALGSTAAPHIFWTCAFDFAQVVTADATCTTQQGLKRTSQVTRCADSTGCRRVSLPLAGE
jgi:hypothetical protein